MPTVPRTQSQDTEARNITIIRFVEREGNESDMLNPLQEYVGKVVEMRVDHGDPTSLVKDKVQEFLSKGKRTCDRYKRIISAEDCYSVATIEENKNTLFLIPGIESQGEAQEAEGQGYEVADRGDQAMEGLKGHEIPHEIIQEREVYQAHDPEVLQQQIQEEESDDSLDLLLNPEMDNAANARILERGTTIIYLKKREGDSHDVSEPANYWEWTDCETLEVPTGDPQNIVGQRMRALWKKEKLKPHDNILRRLKYEDCYKAAKEDEHHTLYMMSLSQQTEEEKDADETLYLMAPSLLTEEEKDADNTLSLNPPPLIPPEMLHWSPHSIPGEQFHWNEEHGRRLSLYASPRAQEETSFGRTTLFVAPPDIPQFPPPPDSPQLLFPPRISKLPLPPQLELVESRAGFHRDKIGRGEDQKVKDQKGKVVEIRQNRVGMSYSENAIEIRKPPVMRTTQQPSQQVYPELKDRRFKDLKTRPKKMAKQNEFFRQDYAELSAAHENLEGEQGQWRKGKEAFGNDEEEL